MHKASHILPAWHEASRLAQERLPLLAEELRRRHGAIPHFGCELEWYVDRPDAAEAIAATHTAVEGQAAAQGLHITPIKPESGHGQYEVGFPVTPGGATLAQSIHDFRALLMEKAAAHGLRILWDAKPHPQDYGSALQVHVHLEDATGARLYEKRNEYLSPTLSASLGGLLAITPEAMPVAAPLEESYARFVPKFDAPVNICWGGNNRSVTIRLPLKTGPLCHIEYRLAGADADPASMLGVLLAGVLHGLEESPHPGGQMHGVASDRQYALPKLPSSLEESIRAFRESPVLRRWLGAEWFAAVEQAYRA